jgi:hypothetical protein
MADQFNRSGSKQQLLKRCSPPAVSPESIEGLIAENYANGPGALQIKIKAFLVVTGRRAAVPRSRGLGEHLSGSHFVSSVSLCGE